MFEQLGAQFHVDAVGGVAEQVVAHGAQHDLKDTHAQQRDHHHVQCRQRAVRQHLVNDHLKNERSDQRNDLHKQRSQQNLAHQSAVLAQRMPEPAHAKLFARCGTTDHCTVHTRHRVNAFGNNPLPGKQLVEFGQRHLLRL